MRHQEMERYARHIQLPGFGKEGQTKVEATRVLLIGCGGLGQPVAQYLTSAGIGTMTLVDDDQVELTNLHRQILFGEDDLGKLKVDVLERHLQRMNRHVRIQKIPNRFGVANALELVQSHDIVIDCTDNFASRALIDRICGEQEIVLFAAAIDGTEGHLSMFKGRDRSSLMDYFPNLPAEQNTPSCSVGGVLGPLCGVVGSLLASEILRFIHQGHTPLDGKWVILRDLYTYHIKAPEASNSQEKRIDTDKMKSITVEELSHWKHNQQVFTLIDVREEYEYEEDHLGGLLIPMGDIPQRWQEIPRDTPVVMQCKAGGRSAQVISYLESAHGFDNLVNLDGGILAYRSRIGAGAL
ncbi:MAG: ThiF family adenylyltransferase [Flavobacteriales bacterium]